MTNTFAQLDAALTRHARQLRPWTDVVLVSREYAALLKRMTSPPIVEARFVDGVWCAYVRVGATLYGPWWEHDPGEGYNEA